MELRNAFHRTSTTVRPHAVGAEFAPPDAVGWISDRVWDRVRSELCGVDGCICMGSTASNSSDDDHRVGPERARGGVWILGAPFHSY